MIKVAGIFAGIAGFEIGLDARFFETVVLCEKDQAARAVLQHHFPESRVVEDVTGIDEPIDVDLITAGFPCQDLSQAGRSTGINGAKSGIVSELFRLVDISRPKWVLIENVPFMLFLHRGAAMELITTNLEALGYRWAYRIVDSRAFGLAQRRRRVFLLASGSVDPAPALLGQDTRGFEAQNLDDVDRPLGFYWTEGNRGASWVVDGVPALKPGSGKGIPSPPAILHPDGFVSVPGIEDAERLQGFPVGWTSPAEGSGGRWGRHRWRLIGNAVSTPVARWLGRRIESGNGDQPAGSVRSFAKGQTWPSAAFFDGVSRWKCEVSDRPEEHAQRGLREYLDEARRPLSAGATRGFADRMERSMADSAAKRRILAALRSHQDKGFGWME